jgi:hypothetical protein
VASIPIAMSDRCPLKAKVNQMLASVKEYNDY